MKEKSPNHTDYRFPVTEHRRFTLIEILMVCALLAFLMAIMVGGYSIASTKMAEADCKSTIEKIATALETYKAKTGYYIQAVGNNSVFYVDDPAGVTPNFSSYIDFEKMKSNGTIVEFSSGRYYLVDPYGTAFWYQCPGKHNRMSFDMESAGPDADFGSSDHVTITDADAAADNIKNWE